MDILIVDHSLSAIPNRDLKILLMNPEVVEFKEVQLLQVNKQNIKN